MNRKIGALIIFVLLSGCQKAQEPETLRVITPVETFGNPPHRGVWHMLMFEVSPVQHMSIKCRISKDAQAFQPSVREPEQSTNNLKYFRLIVTDEEMNADFDIVVHCAAPNYISGFARIVPADPSEVLH